MAQSFGGGGAPPPPVVPCCQKEPWGIPPFPPPAVHSHSTTSVARPCSPIGRCPPPPPPGGRHSTCGRDAVVAEVQPQQRRAGRQQVRERGHPEVRKAVAEQVQLLHVLVGAEGGAKLVRVAAREVIVAQHHELDGLAERDRAVDGPHGCGQGGRGGGGGRGLVEGKGALQGQPQPASAPTATGFTSAPH